jgi:hypothetical protein
MLTKIKSLLRNFQYYRKHNILIFESSKTSQNKIREMIKWKFSSWDSNTISSAIRADVLTN